MHDRMAPRRLSWSAVAVSMTAAALLLVAASCGQPATQARQRTAARESGQRTGARRHPVDRRPTYAISFDRPMSVGFRYRDVTTGSMETKLIIGGKLHRGRSNKVTYVYEALVTIKAIRPGGGVTRKELSIIRLKADRGSGVQTLLPRATVVLARVVGGKKRFTVAGKPVSAQAHKILDNVVSLFRHTGGSNQDLIGTHRRHRVGESWSPNKGKWIAFLKRTIKSRSATPGPEDISGKITLVGVRKVNGVEGLDFRAQIRVDNLAPKLRFGGAGGHTAGHMEMRITGWIPRDPNVAARESVDASYRFYVLHEMVTGGRATTMVVDTLYTHNCTLRPAP